LSREYGQGGFHIRGANSGTGPGNITWKSWDLLGDVQVGVGAFQHTRIYVVRTPDPSPEKNGDVTRSLTVGRTSAVHGKLKTREAVESQGTKGKGSALWRKSKFGTDEKVSADRLLKDREHICTCQKSKLRNGGS